MKDFFKCIGLFAVGLFTAVIGYPLLHEFGHSAAALLVGAKIIDFRLLPVPYITCEMTVVRRGGQILIAAAGSIFPVIFSLFFRPKRFWLWYGNLVMRGICLLSFAISIAAVCLYDFGIVMENEDVVRALEVMENGRFFIVVSAAFLMAFTVVTVVKQRPLERIKTFFDL